MQKEKTYFVVVVVVNVLSDINENKRAHTHTHHGRWEIIWWSFLAVETNKNDTPHFFINLLPHKTNERRRLQKSNAEPFNVKGKKCGNRKYLWNYLMVFCIGFFFAYWIKWLKIVSGIIHTWNRAIPAICDNNLFECTTLWQLSKLIKFVNFFISYDFNGNMNYSVTELFWEMGYKVCFFFFLINITVKWAGTKSGIFRVFQNARKEVIY